MTEIKTNQYIELYNPLRNNYFPVRILNKTQDGYLALSILTDKEINIYNYQLDTYGYRNIWISEKLLSKLDFKKDSLCYTLNDIIIWECLTGELSDIEHPYYLYEYKSKHLGYAILNETEIERFKNDFKAIEYKSNNDGIKSRYSFANSINDILNHLLELKPEEYSYERFDKIFID
ncbi:hypothetical protein [Flavivirga algicola]|uniref:Uncharacterized protein n=1 Tax=Flavivirga algicola TaxID=2729136 RepID=A0ABX1S2H9_9FLAO|nr:hypothetical protein [Flavivirga algicola]NMH89118.1 hypothetical protein [Flavivirga algicola]